MDATPDAVGPASLHGSCGALAGQGVLLLGAAGSGKSDLLLRLIDRGFALVADDRVIVETGCARSPPALAGLIEIRGIGLLRLPHVGPVPLALVLALDEAAFAPAEPRPAAADGFRLPWPACHVRLGLPMLRIAPFHASAAFRIEIALDCLAGRRRLLAGGLDAARPAGLDPA